MKSSLIAVTVLAALCSVTVARASAQSAAGETSSPVAQAKLRNGDVVEMVKAGLAEEVIVAKLQGSPCSFDTSPAALTVLKSAQVPKAVILAMIEKSQQLTSEQAVAQSGTQGFTPRPCDCSNSAQPAQPGRLPSNQQTVVKTANVLDPGAPAHAFDFQFEGGWVFNLPGAQAIVDTSIGIAASPVQQTHAAPSGGVTFWITRYLGAYADFVGIDEGKATASLGGLSATATASLIGSFGGIQLQAYKSRLRPYVDVGGGVWHESGHFSFPTQSFDTTANAGSFRFGGGLRTMLSRRWGVQTSVEVYQIRKDGTSKIFPRYAAGFFFQTKPSGT